MIIFDLREEARLVSLLYLVGGIAVVLGVLAFLPRALRDRLPDALAEAARPLTLVFSLAAAALAWSEMDERGQADQLVERCLAGGCTFVEGPVSDVEPVHAVGSGSRFTPPLQGGSFRVAGTYYAHYPRDNSDYSPANALQNGDWARVHSDGDRVVLVERVDR
ncbi:MAG: hypothetical protein AB1918_18020 [Pseudomonadota bacterium]